MRAVSSCSKTVNSTFCRSIPQRQGPVCGEFAQQTVGQRLDGVVFILLRFGLAADGDHRAVDHRRRALSVVTSIAVVLGLTVDVRGGGRFILGPDIAAIDAK